MYQLDAFTQSNPADQVKRIMIIRKRIFQVVFSGHHQHLQKPAGSQVSQEGRAGDTIIYNLHSLNTGCLSFSMENGRGWGEWAEVLEISKYMALRLSSHPKHEPHQLQETIIGPGLSWSISV